MIDALRVLLENPAETLGIDRAYVLDGSFRVLMTGTKASDISPADPKDSAMPRDLDAVLRRVVADHDFAREAIAVASTATASVRVYRLAGAEGYYYAVMTRTRGGI